MKHSRISNNILPFIRVWMLCSLVFSQFGAALQPAFAQAAVSAVHNSISPAPVGKMSADSLETGKLVSADGTAGDNFGASLTRDSDFAWARGMGGTSDDYGYSIALDSSGNEFTTGAFSGTADFDPGSGSFDLTSAGDYDIFVSKLDSKGDFVWARNMGGTGDDEVIGIALDTNGNIYTMGFFQGTADFDPGAASFNLTGAGSNNIFVSKLDSNGDFVWARSMGWTGDGGGIAVDTSGNVYTTGFFQGTADFDPGTGVANLTSAGSYDSFISKLDSNGDFVWARSMGGMSDDEGYGIALDSSGNVYTTGVFYGTADFDPGAGSFSLTSAGRGDIFVSKLDSNGDFIWAKRMGGMSDDSSCNIALDTSGNAYTIGFFKGTADFDPSAASFNLTSVEYSDNFISKLDSNGDFVWAKRMGGGTNYDQAQTIAFDLSGNVFTTGRFQGTADFDPGAGVANLTSAGGYDIFVSKLDSNGDFVWARSMGGTSDNEGYGIAVDTSGNVYTTGYFTDTIDFNPGAGSFSLTSAGGYDIFISKLGAAPVTYYAKPAASGAGDCSNWDNACTLQTALTGAASGDEIWVAAGTHKPTTVTTERTATFQLKNGVAVYGGFAGTESNRADRNPAANLTILSGDIDNDDSQTPIITDIISITGNTTNSYHVVTGASGATLDGFVITAGNANNSSSYSTVRGGGMYNNGSSPTLAKIIFSGNTASGHGGGMYNDYGSNPTLVDVTFSGNAVNSLGGGMANWSSSPVLTNVTFSNNRAELGGGGMSNSSGSNATLTNVTFSANLTYGGGPVGGGYGGGMYNQGSSPTLTNVTFNRNSSVNNPGPFPGDGGGNGGGMYNYNGSNPQIRNTIFWGNTAAIAGAQIYNEDSTPILSDSVIQSGYAGTNIITEDPMLGTLNNYGGFTQTIQILAGSSAIDSGDDTVCPDTDQRGVARPQGAHCDIGAYESDGTTGNNAPPVITDGASISVTTTQDNSVSRTLHATDADADPLTWSISYPASHGTASASGTGNSKSVDYTPNPGYQGADNFSVQVDDGNGGVDTIVVSVWVDYPGSGISLGVWPANDSVCGFGWPLGNTVNMTIDNPNTPQSPDYSASQTVPTDDWSLYGNCLHFDTGQFDIQTGFTVSLSDGTTTRMHTVTNLTLGGVNLATDTVFGTAEPGAEVYIWTYGPNGLINRWETTDSLGNWSADFSTPGNLPTEQETIDLIPGSNGEVQQTVGYGHTQFHFGNDVSRVSFDLYLHGNSVLGHSWPLNSTVTLSIDDPNQPGAPVYIATAVSHVAPWNSNDTSVDFNIDRNEIVLEPGFTVTLTDGTHTKSTVIGNLAVTQIDVNSNIVRGTASYNLDGRICLSPDSCYPNTLKATINTLSYAAGSWEANFIVKGGTGIYDIQPGDEIFLSDIDNDGDVTNLEIHVPNPYIEANPGSNWVHGRDWPNGTPLTLTIDDPSNGIGVDKTVQANMGQAPWNPGDPNDILANFELGNFDLLPGYILTITDGLTPATQRTYIPTNIAITGLNVETDIVSGTAEPESVLRVDINGGPYCDVTANASGEWVVNFAEGIGCEFTFDLQPGTNGEVYQSDTNGNRTYADWRVPTPKFDVRANYEQIDAWEWPLGSTLTAKIYASGVETAPTSCTHTGTVTGPAPWGDSRNYLSFDLNGICDIQPGNLVIVSDGVTTKKHVVKTLAFDAMDAAADTVSGSAAPGSNVDVWACDDTNCYNRHVTADANGKWIADWSKKGIQEDEQDIFDLVVDTWVDSWQGDDDGDSTMFGNTIPNPNLPPAVNAGESYNVNEGSTITLTASGSDPENGPLTFAWDLNNDGLFETPGQSVTFSAAQFDGPSEHTIVVKVTDSGGLSATAQTTVSILNVAPQVGAITASLDPQWVGSSVSTSATFTDIGTLDTHTAIWDWGDSANSTGIINETNGSVGGNHVYTGAGVYTVKLTITDDDGGAGESFFRYVVVYDAGAGFVTGGGWINSLAGACKLDVMCEGAAGKANFGFEAKYKNGANVPSGQTEFNFKAGNLNFKSTEYQWLVVAGAKAQFKGSGTINGSGGYGFMLTAIDGQINGGGSVDKFRIKIWNKATGAIVYDNQMDAADDATPSTAIGGGSIVIHK